MKKLYPRTQFRKADNTTEVVFRKAKQSADSSSCVEVGSNGDDFVAIRDSKNETGPQLRGPGVAKFVQAMARQARNDTA